MDQGADSQLCSCPSFLGKPSKTCAKGTLTLIREFISNKRGKLLSQHYLHMTIRLEVASVETVGECVCCHPLIGVLSPLCSDARYVSHFSKVYFNPLSRVIVLGGPGARKTSLTDGIQCSTVGSVLRVPLRRCRDMQFIQPKRRSAMDDWKIVF